MIRNRKVYIGDEMGTTKTIWRVLSGDSAGARKQSRAACDISPRGRIARRSVWR